MCGAGVVGIVLGAGGGAPALYGVGGAALGAGVGALALARFGRRPGVGRVGCGADRVARGERVRLTYEAAGSGGGTPRVRLGLREAGGSRRLEVGGRGWRAVSPPLPRGEWQVGEAVAEYEDVLGLAVRRVVTSPAGGTVRVRPRPPAGGVPWVGRLLGREEAAGFEIHALRGYLPGDDPRLVDWRSSLRTGALQVRERRDGGAAPAVVLLDTAGEDGPAFETAVDCAAGVALSVLDLGRPVVLAGVTAGPRRIEPGPGAAGVVLDLLTRVRPRPGAPAAPPPAGALTAGSRSAGALTVVATTRDPARWRPALSAPHGTAVCVHAVPPGAPARTPPQAPGLRVLRVAAPEDLAGEW